MLQGVMYSYINLPSTLSIQLYPRKPPPNVTPQILNQNLPPELSTKPYPVNPHPNRTTGMPKGVMYSNRSTVLHALMLGQVKACGFDQNGYKPCHALGHVLR